jgi:hypothetical protein
MHLTQAEIGIVETMAMAKTKAIPILAKVNEDRKKRRLPHATIKSIYRVLRGEAYQRGRAEKRGRPKALNTKKKEKLEKSRKKLLKKAKNENRVTYDHVIDAAGLKGEVSNRTVRKYFNKDVGAKWRPARTKPERTEEEEEKRLAQAKKWVKKPKDFWTNTVHGYIDNKTFALPLTPAKKAHIRRTKVTGHIRKASEGLKKECVRSKAIGTFIGGPSVVISACASPQTGRIIMFNEVRMDLPGKKKWNGTYAKRMYEGPLLTALKRTYGKQDKYYIVEDGDPAGYQSTLGKKGKKNAGIKSLKLPPRTPSWMPLDFSLWRTIEKKALAGNQRRDTKKSYLKCLRNAAHGLTTSYVKKCCGSLKKRIKATLKAKGMHEKTD